MESSIQPSQIENSILLQLFRDSFVMKGDFYNVKKQKVFPDIKKRMEFSSVVQGDDDIVLRDINLQEIVPSSHVNKTPALPVTSYYFITFIYLMMILKLWKTGYFE